MRLTKSELDEILKNNKHITIDRGSPRKASDSDLIESYKRTSSVWKTASEFSMCGQSVWERLKRLNVIESVLYSHEQEALIRNFYSKEFKRGDLDIFCKNNSMLKTSVSRWAKTNGLNTSYKRKFNEAHLEKTRESFIGRWDRSPHPRGMLGKKHTPECIERIRVLSTKMMQNMSPQKKRERITKGLKTRASNGTLIRPRKTTWKQGWRTIGTRRLYLRSQWEANYASYIEFLAFNKQIQSWDYECETFWFDKIKRGTNNYTPDFKIFNNDGTFEFHEVKGWMDARSKTKIRRMKKYHPNVVLRIIDKEWFKKNNSLSKIIPGWGTPAEPKEVKGTI